MPAYMKFTTGGDTVIMGEATDPAHKHWIELDSFSWGGGRSPAANTSQGGTDKPAAHDVTVTKALDSASPRLMRESLVGTPGTGIIEFVDKNGNVYLRVTLENVLIAGINLASGGGRPSEALNLNFSKATQGFISPSALDITDRLESMLRQLNFLRTP